jgi:hypothetical protein
MRTAMPDLDASAAAKLLGEFGQRSALRGGNPYRARAYRRAAENCRSAQAVGRGSRALLGLGRFLSVEVCTQRHTGEHWNHDSVPESPNHA